MNHAAMRKIHLSDLSRYLTMKEREAVKDFCRDNYWGGFHLVYMKLTKHDSEMWKGIKKTLQNLMDADELPQSEIVMIQS